MDPNQYNSTPSSGNGGLPRQSSAVEVSPTEETVRNRRPGSVGQAPQMQDIRPSVSSADQFAPPPRQASLTALASGLTIEDNAAVPPRAPVQVPVLAANGQYMPPSRNDSLMSVDQVNAKVAIAARHAMGIEDANRGTLTKEDAAVLRAAAAATPHPMQKITSANIEQALLNVTSPVGGNFDTTELMSGPSMPALQIDSTPSNDGSEKTPVSGSSSSGANLHRRQTHNRPERRHPRYLLRNAAEGEVGTPDDVSHKKCSCECKPWTCYYRTITLCCPAWCLNKICKMPDAREQNAWREKIGLVSIILLLCFALGFLTFGFVKVACNRSDAGGAYDSRANIALDGDHRYIIHGNVYNYGPFIDTHVAMPNFAAFGNTTVWAIGNATGQDISALFPKANSSCAKVAVLPITITCTANEFFLPPSAKYCHKYEESQAVLATLKTGWISYQWDNVRRPLMVYNSRVLNMRSYLSKGQKFLGEWAHQVILANLGSDATITFSGKENGREMADCLADLYTVGYVQSDTVGCIATDIVLNVSLIVILGVVLVRFFMALAFDWLISWRLGQIQDKAHLEEMEKRKKERRCGCCKKSEADKYKSAEDYLAAGGAGGRYDFGTSTQNSPIPSRSHSRRNSMSSISSEMLDAAASMSVSSSMDQQYAYGVPSAAMKRMSRMSIASVDSTNSIREKHHDIVLMAKDEQVIEPPMPDETFMLSQEYREYGEIYTVLLVTTYSESEESCRTTLDSLAKTSYDDQYKMLFIVSDGIITGSGNEKSTPQILIDMIELDQHLPNPPIPQSYLAIADGSKKHNMAQVYAGHYVVGSHRVPTILVVKCGTPEEQKGSKPGNRGKRDSQVILMSFFQKATFDDRMSPLEFDIFNKMRYITGVPPDRFEIVLMVDADTKVAPDALSRMVAVMGRDHGIIGLCGETRIGNKTDSWVTRIQVFEYYISHHLTKAFESMFGGVTCLPGCFCMWRIKVPKGDGLFVPVVCNPDILAEYSQSQVDTLHEKNLLLLGEDRFLTTLMLKTFPKRKLIFVPKAYCKTTVPDRFKILLSQRRRWINSTVHNLMELVLVRELCGTFCFSMQFVVFMELVGTVVLPAAITFTGVLVASSIYSGLTGGTIEIIPLLLLFAILGLPAFLILLQAKRVVYVYWMFLYLLALPIWNFILPAYAFWHFDDFSWGATRAVSGEAVTKDGHASDGIHFDTNVVVHKKWSDWERERRRVLIKDWDLPVERTASIGALAVQKWVKQQQELEEGGQRIGDIVVPLKAMMGLDPGSARPKTMYR